MFRIHISYVISRGHVSYTFGEDGRDNYEDTHDMEFSMGDGSTPREALTKALEALPAGLEAHLPHLPEDEVHYYREDVEAFLGGGWKLGSCRIGFDKPLRKFEHTSTRWRICCTTVNENSHFGCDPVDLDDEPETVAALTTFLAEAA